MDKYQIEITLTRNEESVVNLRVPLSTDLDAEKKNLKEVIDSLLKVLSEESNITINQNL